MEEKKKKFYELTEEERKIKNHETWLKIKPFIKKVLIATFCIVVCLLMVFAFFSGMFASGNNTSECIKFSSLFH